ncbi:MAG: C-terminal binding protein [Armatimonadota bacterium]
MKEWKVIVTDYIEDDLDWEEGEFEKMDNVVFETYQLKNSPKSEVIDVCKDADIIVVNMVEFDAEVIDALEDCILIIRHGVGYDNVDVEACTRNNIRFAYEPDYCATEVAEQAVALIFACTRQLFRSRDILEESSENQIWDFSTLLPMHRMFDQTLGVIGCGRIGGRVYRMTKNIFARTIVCDPYIDERQKGALGIQDEDLLEFDDFIAEADVITIHTPLNEETEYMFNADVFAAMKDSAYLVNTARGGIVNTDDLIEALKNEEIQGAGIDVYEKEPPLRENELFDLDRATLSAHLGWCSEEAGWKIRYQIMDDIKAAIAGDKPTNTVNEEIDHIVDGNYREV